jgi:hypothetical protein
LQFGIIATLQDGTELKTKNLGGKTDFEESYDISVPGCIYVDGKIEVGTDASFFTNDEISVIIKNLHNPNQQLIHKIPIPYNLPIEIFMNGKNGNSGTSGNSGNRNCSNGSAGQAGYNGEDGSDCTIKIIETKHKITGATLYAAEITRMRDKKIFKLKWDASSPITINNSGGKGGEGGRGGYLASGCKNGIARGGSGGPGGTGGRGGNVNITMSSVNIPKSAIVINNNGGKGGIPGEGKDGGSTGISGKDGIDGKIEINTSAVKLSW